MSVSTRDHPNRHTEGRVSRELYTIAYWVQRHEGAIKAAHFAVHGYGQSDQEIHYLEEPSMTIAFYLRRISLHNSPLHRMGDIFLILQAKIGGMLVDLEEAIRADRDHDKQKVVHYRGLDGRGTRPVTIVVFQNLLLDKIETLMDWAPILLAAMNTIEERERALRILEGTEDMSLPTYGYATDKNIQKHIFSYCMQLSPHLIHAHLNQKHRDASKKEKERISRRLELQNILAVEPPLSPSFDGTRLADLSYLQVLRGNFDSNSESIYKDSSYFSESNIRARIQKFIRDKNDSGYHSATDSEIAEFLKNMASEAIAALPNRHGSNSTYLLPLITADPTRPLEKSQTAEFHNLAAELWTRYDCASYATKKEIFDWNALIGRYPRGYDDKPFEWEAAFRNTLRLEAASGGVSCSEDIDDFDERQENTEVDTSEEVSESVTAAISPTIEETVTTQDRKYESKQDIARKREGSYATFAASMQSGKGYKSYEQSLQQRNTEQQDDNESIFDEKRLEMERAKAMAMLEGTDEDANVTNAAWGNGAGPLTLFEGDANEVHRPWSYEDKVTTAVENAEQSSTSVPPAWDNGLGSMPVFEDVDSHINAVEAQWTRGAEPITPLSGIDENEREIESKWGNGGVAAEMIADMYATTLEEPKKPKKMGLFQKLRRNFTR